MLDGKVFELHPEFIIKRGIIIVPLCLFSYRRVKD